MIEFLTRGEIATPARMMNKFAFNTLPLGEYKCEFVGAPSYVLAANSVAVKGHPIRLPITGSDTFDDAIIVEGETHKRETSHIRIICDTLNEVVALMNTRKPIQEIIKKNAGYVDPSEIRKQIEAVYAEVKARFSTPKEVKEDQTSPGEALMARVSARLERLESARPAMPSHLERASSRPAVFGRRM